MSSEAPDADMEAETEKELHSEDQVPEDDETTILPHQVAMEQFKDCLAELIVGDPLLSDLPTAVTMEEVSSQIALAHGQAMTVNVRRADDHVLPIVVVNSATVHDLKRAIRRHVTLKQERENGTLHISWKYIWKSYWLYFSGEKLIKDTKPLKEYGIRNKDEVTFIKRLRPK
ncbi:U11/U12 small nuclear ribonucleoprotein 25 kDa protein [Lamellibrachia satsuma]|nr:U11/U12 small nuclear ribonucleoprotein 25 kDa protein [Lamellibrachia satsuma]